MAKSIGRSGRGRETDGWTKMGDSTDLNKKKKW